MKPVCQRNHKLPYQCIPCALICFTAPNPGGVDSPQKLTRLKYLCDVFKGSLNRSTVHYPPVVCHFMSAITLPAACYLSEDEVTESDRLLPQDTFTNPPGFVSSIKKTPASIISFSEKIDLFELKK